MFGRLALIGAAFWSCVSLTVAIAAEGPAFQAASCRLAATAVPAGRRLVCGTVVVPRQRGSAAAGSFRLAVVIIQAASAAKRPDPVVYIAGGPGSPLTARAALIARHEADVVAPDRDLILIDQRGAGNSEPLLCPDLAGKQLEIFAAGMDQATLVEAWRATYRLCRLQMAHDGINPEWFGSQISAEDLDAVRQALGIDRWNVFALSYGTAVGLSLMALHPETLRAVVLDSVLPPDPLPMTLQQSFDRALEMLFAVCRGDAACAKAHPALAATYAEALRGLDAAPLSVAMPPGSRVVTFALRAEVFRLIVDRLLYSRSGMAVLPSFTAAARDRKAGMLQAVIARVAGGYASMFLGDMAAVECRERPSWRSPSPAEVVPVSAFVPGMCADWSQPGPPPLMPVNTNVPTLILTGALDPITPPAFAGLAATTMGPKARVIEFANVGHGAASSSSCGESVTTSFMQDPTKVEAGCASAIPPATLQ